MSTLQDRCQALETLKATVNAEDFARAKIKYGDKFVELNKQIAVLVEKQQDLLNEVPDSHPEYEALKQEVIAIMNQEGIYGVGNVSARFKEKNEVNKSRVLQMIDGDIDLYITLSSITQTSLKDFAKSSELKKDLLSCIETVSREIVDIAIEPPVTA